MKAAVLEKFGTTPVYKDFEDPVPGNDDQQLIHVKAAPLKNFDRLTTVESFYANLGNLPAVVGSDGAGVLDDGNRVYAPGISGMMAEKAVIPKDSYTKIPDELDFATAAALPNAVMGGVMPLRLRTEMQKGDTILINGATGFTGQLAVQAAKYYGAGNIIATGRDEGRLELLKELGADNIISLKQPDENIVEQLNNINTDNPFDIVIDYLWGHPAELIIEVLQGGGPRQVKIINTGTMAGENISVSANAVRSSAIEVLGAGMGSYSESEFKQLGNELVPEMFQLAAENKLRVHTLEEPLKNIENAWNKEVEPGTRLVLVVD
jgi:NADPH:quinone reductase-like Zn-dependent oxidoreductase